MRPCGTRGRAKKPADDLEAAGLSPLTSTKSPYSNSLEEKSRSKGGWYPTAATLPSRTSMRVKTAWLNRRLVGADARA